MDRDWISITDRLKSRPYINGVQSFIDFASPTQDSMGRILCPCRNCLNNVRVKIGEVREHLLIAGMTPEYKQWTHHGEKYRSVGIGSASSGADQVVQTRDDMVGFINDILVAMQEPSPIPTTDGAEVPTTDGDEVPIAGGGEEPDEFTRLLRDAQSEAYSGCKKISKLSLILRFLNEKTKFGWSNKSMDAVFNVLWLFSPAGHSLPRTYYEAKKMLRGLGLGYIKIHACPNHCVLYWKENEHLQKCPNPDCCSSRWKPGKDNGRKVPAKILRYFPLTPRLQRLYASKSIAEEMRWHNKPRDPDVISHPADGEQWKDFNVDNEEFAKDPRNVRLGLATDGFTPFGTSAASWSMWPVAAVVYNMSPARCMAEEFIMMPLLIPGRNSPGNNIDVHLRPLIDELKELFDVGVRTFDAHTGEWFTLRAAVMWTINDYPAYAMLSGYSTKGTKACDVCGDNTDSIRLPNCRKHVYMGARKFLQRSHHWRDSLDFNGKVELEKKSKRVIWR